MVDGSVVEGIVIISLLAWVFPQDGVLFGVKGLNIPHLAERTLDYTSSIFSSAHVSWVVLSKLLNLCPKLPHRSCFIVKRIT